MLVSHKKILSATIQLAFLATLSCQVSANSSSIKPNQLPPAPTIGGVNVHGKRPIASFSPIQRPSFRTPCVLAPWESSCKDVDSYINATQELQSQTPRNGQLEDASQCPTEHPVIPSSGRKIKDELDFESSEEMGLFLKRYYSNGNYASGYLFGSNWRSNFETSLSISSFTLDADGVELLDSATEAGRYDSINQALLDGYAQRWGAESYGIYFAQEITLAQGNGASVTFWGQP